MSDKVTNITMLVTSDVHGNIFPTTYRDHEPAPQGLARVATLIKRIREEKKHVLLLDNGDMIQGTPLTYHHAKYQAVKDNPLIRCMNELKYDAAVIGNHEFNYGMPYLQSAIQLADFPYLCGNILDERRKEPVFGRPYEIKQIDGIKLAIIGITTHFIPNWEDPNHIKGLAFEHVLESTRRWVKEVREKEQPDVLIVAYHGGFERDLETGEPTESLTGENVGYEICHSIEGIDILVTGHQHRSLAEKVNNVTVVQPGSNGAFLGEVSIAVENVHNSRKRVVSEAKLHTITNEIEPDETILRLVSSYEEETQKWLDQPIGKIDGDMIIHDAFETRVKETAFIEFINKVQMDAANVAISSTALFHNASPGFPQNITMRDIVSNYIYPNTLKVIEISGADMKHALELSATYFNLDQEGELEVSRSFLEPKPQHYNYDMWEGIDYTLDISREIGDRVQELTFKGNPVIADEMYEVVMNNYRAAGGGDYVMFKGKQVVKEITTDMTELIADYISKRSVIEATCNHNWVVNK
ncbi:bifunctional metallophosphatase/5'-nucleotidase [Terribacillus saccharophilus]|uniref:bifunctional metallophosphatase/5'-nucleotidase n=1 Tax=Terribacillus saccharophilus TaxID=361277 RepID=UPI000BA4EABA|nr:bifunctional UDP-sugar hydrolase/5'-nucleotidase [Terribacillus saccharophilus]PAF37050.1 bifunctional metallophosphatase/5'-nucleotidase [Terribacillus saccharophilus]